MTPYKSKSGKDSGVIAYEIGNDYIIVEFKTRDVYTYSYSSADEEAIEEMKRRALASEGLSTFIPQEDPDFESMRRAS
jgi:hypothetical protein